LEQTPNIQIAHPLPGGFSKPRPNNEGEFCSCFFIGLSLNIQKNSKATIDLTPPVTDFTGVVKDWPMKTATMDVRVRYVKRTDLPEFVFPEGEKPKPAKRERKKREKPQDDTPEGKAKKQKGDGEGELVTTETETKNIEDVLTYNAEVDMSGTGTIPDTEIIDISMENADQRPSKALAKADTLTPTNGQDTTKNTPTTPTSIDGLTEKSSDTSAPTTPTDTSALNGNGVPKQTKKEEFADLDISLTSQQPTSRPVATTRKPVINLLK